MDCNEVAELLDRDDEGEQDVTVRRAMENHFDTCSTCRDKRQSLQTLRTALRDRSLYRPAPDAFRQRLLRSLPTVSESAPSGNRLPIFAWGNLAAAMGIALVAFFAGGALHPFSAGGTGATDNSLVAEVVSDHVRSLQPNHLMDVISTDKHTVKPWFNGKLDFAPPVTDFKDQGFPLVGGRLDALSGHPVAAMIYHRQKHVINLLVWPATDTGPTTEGAGITAATYRGYHILQWRQAEMHYALVSDLNEAELRTLAHLLSE